MISVCLTLGPLEAEPEADIQVYDLRGEHSHEKGREGSRREPGKELSKKGLALSSCLASA